MTDPMPLPDNVLRNLHLAEFAAGFVSPETKAFLLKAEPLLPSLQQHGIALDQAALAIWGDLKALWPALEPAVAALIGKVNAGVPAAAAVADVRADAITAHGFDQQDGAR